MQVKICGLTRRADAECAAEAGADFAGLVFAPGKRTVSPRDARDILDGSPLRRVGVFVNLPLGDLLKAIDAARLDVVQLHGDEHPDYIARLRAEWPGEIWKAFRPRSAGELVREVAPFQGAIDAVLLDAWSPEARGGTGESFSWNDIASVRCSVAAGLPLVLAGGLREDNVAAAARILSPDIVDVSSGVETAPGLKDPDAVRRFVRAAHIIESPLHPIEPAS